MWKPILPAVRNALYSLDERDVELIIVDEPQPAFNLELLHDVLERQIEASGLIGSLFIMDLQTGEEIAINADIALSGMSIVKIPIMLELFHCRRRRPQCRSTKPLPTKQPLIPAITALTSCLT